MKIKEIVEILNIELQKELKANSYQNFFHEVYDYSLLPAGKLFRPLLCSAISLDITKEISPNVLKLATMLEMHHTYTLMHDDLPAMDDDDQRRGRPSSHKKFNEWSALLAGDGLLNASYRLLSQIRTPHLGEIINYISWALGPKGLILGQALDLSGKMNDSIQDLILTHKLKTARLIQVSLVGSLVLSKDDVTLKELKSYHRLGEKLGLAFQFIDDLSELSDKELSEHEKEVNPWLHSPEDSEKVLSDCLMNVENFFTDNQLPTLEKVIDGYLKKMRTHIIESSDIIKNHVRIDLDPTISRLN